MKNIKIGLLLFFLIISSCSNSPHISKIGNSFQTAGFWSKNVNIEADRAIVYSYNKDFESRLNSWREKSYQVDFMTGASWGDYQDFYSGEFDGIKHNHEGQRRVDSSMVMHGPNIPYLVPTDAFISYLKTRLEKAIDCGVERIFMEEPEYWTFAGYSELFKAEWKKHYKTNWQAQESSPTELFKTAKLKSLLFHKLLSQLASHTKLYSSKIGQKTKFYVPTHSVLNYALWNIISPYSSLQTDPNIDGFIGQVWTGTSRTPTVYDGIYKERTLENAYLEYAALSALVDGTQKDMIFLTDPIEDDPTHTWQDYEQNYKKTFAAQLMFPNVNSYEVMPWPHRIFNGEYQTSSGKLSKISTNYSTQLSLLINSLNSISELPKSFNKNELAVGVSKSLMYQNSHKDADKDDFRRVNFYGLAFPLLKNYIPFDLLQLDNIDKIDVLKNHKILILSYENMKPLSALVNQKIAQWVESGGVLVYVGDDKNDFNSIEEWWNQKAYSSAFNHLTSLLGVESKTYAKVGKGYFYHLNTDPSNYVTKSNGDESYVTKITSILKKKIDFESSKSMMKMCRGNFTIAMKFSERKQEQKQFISGSYLNLFDISIPVVKNPQVLVDKPIFMYDLKQARNEFQLLASSARFTAVENSSKKFTALININASSNFVSCIAMNQKPKSVLIDGQGINFQWNREFKFIRINYNSKDKNSYQLTIIK